LTNQDVHNFEAHHIILVIFFIWQGEFIDIKSVERQTLDLFKGFNNVVSTAVFLEDDDPMLWMFDFSLEVNHVSRFKYDIAPIHKTRDALNSCFHI
jgi:hypothetical protein